jgi:manganese efflux pump family protein
MEYKLDLITTLVIAFGLSMDAFAVAISSGLAMERIRIKNALKIGSAFGLFQAGMPILGWLAGSRLRTLISELDHWVAFGLLALIGGKMIYEAVCTHCDERAVNALDNKTLLGLSIATSIDALAVGISFAFLEKAVFVPSLIIGSVTFLLSTCGVLLGHRFGCYLGKRVEIAGGLVLIAIGFKILIEHLSQG